MDERGARTGEGDSGLTPLVTMFSGARVSHDIPRRIPLCQSEMTDRKSNSHASSWSIVSSIECSSTTAVPSSNG